MMTVLYVIAYIIMLPLCIAAALNMEWKALDGKVSRSGLLLGIVCSFTPILQPALLFTWVIVMGVPMIDEKLKYFSEENVKKWWSGL